MAGVGWHWGLKGVEYCIPKREPVSQRLNNDLSYYDTIIVGCLVKILL